MSSKQEPGMMDQIGEFLFGKRMTPEEHVKKWKRDLNKEKRELDRNIRGIEREEMKVKREIKASAKRGDMSSAKTLAKELVRSKKAKERIAISKAQLNSVQMQLAQNLATYKMAGTLKKSTEIMTMMNNLIRLPELQHMMMAMAREMEKAGLIDEVIQDTLEDMGEEDLDQEADEAVQKVLDELDLDFREEAPEAGREKPGQKGKVAEPENDEMDAEDEALQARLNSLNQ
jgi:charged multivesicular body protein 3